MKRTAALIAAIFLLAAGGPPRSGYDDASPETRAMQDDDAANPGFLWVAQGETQWPAPAFGGQSCALCHGPIESMRGIAARYPAFDPKLNRIVTLRQRINLCRTTRMGAPALEPGDVSLETAIGVRSRGMPLAVEPREPFLSAGAALFRQRMGQFNISCAQCHDERAGQRLAGSIIPQAHPNGYPEYRLEWQGMGSLYRRIRNCMTGVRAEPFAEDSADMEALALYLAVRANGMRIETPGVRP